MALNAKRSPALPVATVPISYNGEDENVGLPISPKYQKSESAEGFEILDDTEVAEVRGLGLQDEGGPKISRRASPSANISRNSSYASLGLRPHSGRASPDVSGSRSNSSSSSRPDHRRKSSISSIISGAIISREKSPGPAGEDKSRHAKKTKEKVQKQDKDTLSIPPPVVSKPGWLKRTASAGKIMITGGSSKESSPSNSPVIGPAPSLPPRKTAVSLSSGGRGRPNDALSTPQPRMHSPSASMSIPSTLSGYSAVPDHRASLAVLPSHDRPLTAAHSFEDKLLPPPKRSSMMLPSASDASRGHHSLDGPRTLSQVGSNGLATVNTTGITAGLRTGLGAVNRRLGAWSQETGAPANTKSYLQAGSGAIGSAVSSGWSAFRSGSSKSSIPPSSISSSVGSPSGRSVSSMYLSPSNGSVTVDLNAVDGPHIDPALIRRPAVALDIKGEVFGRQLSEACELWPIVNSDLDLAEPSQMSRKGRTQSLPAILVRCVDYLCIWAPQEEGIFRISGRSSHIALLRKHFDAGADVNLEPCDPGDIDPHSVASLYKSYLRELPTPILTSLFNEFDEVMTRYNGCSAQDQTYISAISGAMSGQNTLLELGKRDKDLVAAQIERERRQSLREGMKSEMTHLLGKLPDENWWLLADLARLLALTDRHQAMNKMKMQNLLMVFCPSLNLSPPFLKYLCENHDILFTKPESEDIRHSKTIVVTSPSIASIKSPRSPSPARRIDKDNEDDRSRHPSPTSPSASVARPKIKIPDAFTQGQDSQRFSTPIADKFARVGPVEIKLRDEPEQAV